MHKLYTGVDLVIFDFDGVLADSEVISLQTLRDTLCQFSIDLHLDEVRRRYLGASLEKIAQTVAKNGCEQEVAAFKAAWEKTLFARFQSELVPVPGAVALVERLTTRGIPYCIASSGTVERIGVALGAMTLEGRFPHVFSAEQVSQGKPEPDLFLYAARTMKASTADCLVIEDSPFGVTAARRAGMRALGFVGGAHLSDLRNEHADLLRQAGAHGIVASLDEIIAD